MATTRLNQNPGERNTKKVKKTSLYEPYFQFRRALEAAKKASFINILETLTPSRKLGEVKTFLNFMGSNAKDVLLQNAKTQADRDQRANTQGTVREVLFRFYHSTWMLKKLWDKNKANKSAIDIGVGRIVQQAGLKEHVKRRTDEKPVVLACGLAKFSTRTGGPTSKHVVAQKKLVQKVIMPLCHFLLAGA